MNDLSRWIDEHYDVKDAGTAFARSAFVCKRCGQEVGYVTKHAQERHGDDIEVLPVVEPSLADKW